LLTVAYDGTDYCGWQRQINGISVQQRLEEALEALLGHGVKTTAASRTDAGVHALGQRVAFDGGTLKIPLDKLPQVLNGLLPPDISVGKAETVADDFSPRFAAKCKTYTYRLCNASAPNPLQRRYSAFVPRTLGIPAMQKAAQAFVGRFDFASFCATGGSTKTTVREIHACEISCENAVVLITVTGNGFLYNMVRIIAGTLVYVGLGKLSPDSIKGIIAAKDRTLAGKTMPPEGLTLLDVVYN
jgi:tRNA pseudouridine38-40 synthase